MQKSTKIPIAAIAAVIAVLALAVSQPFAYADAPPGRFNPQTQFPVGTTVTFTSLNGVASQRASGEGEKPEHYDASFTITAKVTELTERGNGIHWEIVSGSFTINGQTYSITKGIGHMNSFDIIGSGMRGEATGPDGATYRWRLGGLAALYNGVVIVGLRGGIGTRTGDGTFSGYHMGFIATMTAS